MSMIKFEKILAIRCYEEDKDNLPEPKILIICWDCVNQHNIQNEMATRNDIITKDDINDENYDDVMIFCDRCRHILDN